jgi:hypothetical protein
LEQERARIVAQLEQANQQGGFDIVDPLTGMVTRMLPGALDAELQAIDQRLQALRQQSQQYQERAREILQGQTRTGANEAELRRQRAAEDIAKLRETFDARLRIEREYQERLDRIRRAAETGAIDKGQRRELETQALRAREEALQRLARSGSDAEERRIDALRRQLELASLVDERERFVAERVSGLTGEQRIEAERLANALFDLQQARREENQALSEVARLYDETRTPIERYIEALERLGELRPLLEVRFGVEGASEIISRRAEALVDILNKAENQAGKTNDVARQLGFTFESAFEDAILRGRKLSEVLQGIATDIARIFIRRTITEPIANWFGGLFSGIFGSAKGNVFEQGDLVPFARGGVVDRPTIFPFARGIGLMGEAGPEAIMPLARDSQGRLGVRASGASPVINQTINVNVSGGGVSDMVEQQRLAREIGRLTRAGVIAAIQEQQRAGGLLRPSPQMV